MVLPETSRPTCSHGQTLMHDTSDAPGHVFRNMASDSSTCFQNQVRTHMRKFCVRTCGIINVYHQNGSEVRGVAPCFQRFGRATVFVGDIRDKTTNTRKSLASTDPQQVHLPARHAFEKSPKTQQRVNAMTKHQPS